MTTVQIRHKTGIRRKVILIICVTTLIVMTLGVGFGYFFGFSVLRDTAGNVHRKMSQLLATHMTAVFDEEMARISSYAEDPVLRDAVTKKSDIDANERLTAIAKADTNIAEISVCDVNGAMIGTSGKKTTGFYPADKKWREEFLAAKKGQVYIGDIEFSERQKAWVIPAVITVRGEDGGAVGILRVDLASDKFFSSVGEFRMDGTGHAVLIDGKGNVIYHPGIAQMNVRFCGNEDYRKLLTSSGKFATIYEPNLHRRDVFVAFSEIIPPVLLDNGKAWRVLIVQYAQEVFSPVRKILAWILLAVVFLLVVMAVIGYFFSRILVGPVQALYNAVAQIKKGNWDYKIDIHTGDEIEELADAFEEMISTIKGKQELLESAKDELEVFSKDLEKKVKERTIDLSTARDKLDRYSKELEKALLVKSDFISMASHELRTPLAAMKEGIGIVLEGKTGDVNAQQKEFLDMAKRNLDRLGRIINDILDFQKLEYGKVALKMEDHDMNEIVREACNTMMTMAAEKDIEIVADLADNLPPIRFDKDRIMQVITNLLSNAIKFTEKGTVMVTTSRGNNTIQVSVKDTGPGIKDEDVPLLFQKFSQLERGLERKTGGSGLGLTISKEIIEIHRGKIWVESKYGEGSTFSFLLPIKERRVYEV